MEVLRRMGAERALVVCGKEGLDEISPEGETWVSIGRLQCWTAQLCRVRIRIPYSHAAFNRIGLGAQRRRNHGILPSSRTRLRTPLSSTFLCPRFHPRSQRHDLPFHTLLFSTPTSTSLLTTQSLLPLPFQHSGLRPPQRSRSSQNLRPSILLQRRSGDRSSSYRFRRCSESFQLVQRTFE